MVESLHLLRLCFPLLNKHLYRKRQWFLALNNLNTLLQTGVNSVSGENQAVAGSGGKALRRPLARLWPRMAVVQQGRLHSHRLQTIELNRQEATRWGGREDYPSWQRSKPTSGIVSPGTLCVWVPRIQGPQLPAAWYPWELKQIPKRARDMSTEG